MKKYILPILFMSLFYWSCEEESDSEVTLWGVTYSIGWIRDSTYLDLSNSDLTGEIPPEIGNLTNLDYLDLGDNDLTGEIPPEIGNLTKLEELHLGDNALTGKIPDNICNLTINWISSYDFSIDSNQLCPPYPSCIEDYVGEQDTTNCD